MYNICDSTVTVGTSEIQKMSNIFLQVIDTHTYTHTDTRTLLNLEHNKVYFFILDTFKLVCV